MMVRDHAKVAICSAGAVTSLGQCLATSSAAIRAGLDRFQSTAFVDRQGQPITGAPADAPALETQPGQRVGGGQRLGHFLTLAAEECCQRARLALPLDRAIPVLFTSDGQRRDTIDQALNYFLDANPHLIDPDTHRRRHMEAFGQGETAIMYALDQARQHLANGAPYVMILGVDSWLNVRDIEHALSQQRLLTSDNAAGFIPGEAAGAILLTSQTTTPAGHSPTLHITGLGLADETAALHEPMPCYGAGLTRAVQAALTESGWPAHSLALRVSDNSGEEYFFEESAYAWNRVLREPLPEHYRHLVPAAQLGQIGCAFGPVLMAHLWQLAQQQRLGAERILMHLSSAQPQRGAVCLQYHP